MIVIGAGVVGLACAYFLARVGRSVCVIDSNAPGSGASNGNAGLITPSHALPVCRPGAVTEALKSLLNPSAPLVLKPKAIPGMLRWMLTFAKNTKPERTEEILAARLPLLQASRLLTEKLVKSEKLDVGWSPTGVMSVCKTQAGYERLGNFVERASALGLDVELLEGQALERREPALVSEVAGAALHRGDAQVQPAQFTTELARLCRERGVTFEIGRAVTTLNTEQGAVHSAYTSPGLHQADHYLLAAGVWSAQLLKPLGLRLPLQPGKGYSVTGKAPEPCPIRALILEERSIAVTPFSEKYRLAGTMEFSGLDDRMDPRRVGALVDGAAEYLREPIGKGQQQHWYGYRPMTPDDMPLIGSAPGISNLTLACGHNMLGMSMAMATGRLATELIAGAKPHIDPAPYAPDRYAT